MFVNIEVSNQDIPRTQEANGALVPSAPLFDLEHVAPSVPTFYDPEGVGYPMSNDESIAYFDQVQARTLTPEYQNATNRVAILVGESSLMSVLPFIAEETIILLDKSPEMCAYMNDYVGVLRNCKSADEWTDVMGVTSMFDAIDAIDSGTIRLGGILALSLYEQANELERTGYSHAYRNADVYSQSHELAQKKAIIAWPGDVSSERDMERLGQELRNRNANVTLINLTNVLASRGEIDQDLGSEDIADVLGRLPIVTNAPILTTSCTMKPLATPHSVPYIVEATGPFFGLDNLSIHGGDLQDLLSSARERQQKQFESSLTVDELMEPELQRLAEFGSSLLDLEIPEELQFIHDILDRLGSGEQSPKKIVFSELPRDLQEAVVRLMSE